MNHLIAILCTAATAAASEGFVYHNTTTRIGTLSELVPAGAAASSVERGNRVILAGPEREVSYITIYARILGTGVATFDLRVRLYANDGPGGEPGTQLWDSGERGVIIDSGADLGFTMAAPGVRVSDTFTWTAQIKNRAGSNTAAIGLPHYNPPTIGAAPLGYWERSAGVWQPGSAAALPLGATVFATSCYANCNNSTTAPVLNVLDFACFLNKFAAGDPNANCDGSTTPPTLNVLDFVCFLNRFAAGCS